MERLGIAKRTAKSYEMEAKAKIRLSAFYKRVEIIDNLLEYFNWNDEVVFFISELGYYYEIQFIFRNCQACLEEILNFEDFLDKYDAWADWAKPEHH